MHINRIDDSNQYFQILDAFNVQIAKKYPTSDPSYNAVALLCEACAIATLVNPYHYNNSKFIELIVECSRYEYARWISTASQIIEDADLSFLPEPALCKSRLHAAFTMANGWLFQLSEIRKGNELPPSHEYLPF